MVLGGSAAQRASQIRHVKEAHDVDVLITSYPLIRQDIEQLTTIEFRFAILDEAQHIKNAGSKGAQAVRQLQAQTRFALTGTPLENGVGELWSIFNFVLPGYLLSYSAFLRRYQDGTDAEDLRRRISPFLMRRLKKEVLTELPDKIESVFTAQMSPEQAKVYEATTPSSRKRASSVGARRCLRRLPSCAKSAVIRRWFWTIIRAHPASWICCWICCRKRLRRGGVCCCSARLRRCSKSFAASWMMRVMKRCTWMATRPHSAA